MLPFTGRIASIEVVLRVLTAVSGAAVVLCLMVAAYVEAEPGRVAERAEHLLDVVIEQRVVDPRHRPCGLSTRVRRPIVTVRLGVEVHARAR